MKTTALTLVIIMGSIQAICQNIQVILYSYDPCSEKVEQLSSFGLVKDGVTYSVSDSTGVLSLKEPGDYMLSYVVENIVTAQLGKVYKIRMVGETVSDTLSLVSIYSCLEPTSHPDFAGYCCCGEKCEGKKVEYYPNGNKRIEGCFKRGLPVGEVKLYYPNGQIKQIDSYNRKGKMVRRILYDEMGNIESSESY